MAAPVRERETSLPRSPPSEPCDDLQTQAARAPAVRVRLHRPRPLTNSRQSHQDVASPSRNCHRYRLVDSQPTSARAIPDATLPATCADGPYDQTGNRFQPNSPNEGRAEDCQWSDRNQVAQHNYNVVLVEDQVEIGCSHRPNIRVTTHAFFGQWRMPPRNCRPRDC